ncbi:Protection of telomeres protein 1 [Dissostichus eleginoides]|uniref:Protection of telomeres protein 1 n=1 Tax=Dissostichus eleginoides TaxID=100907 RepID=A0AAD9C410_DISEL|nr:Protection of telomeres protein 1 [Dissostichus eleginoides]
MERAASLGHSITESMLVQQTDVNMVSLFCLVVGLSPVDGNSSVSQHWLGTRLYHPSSTGSHCRFNDASQYPQPDSVFTNLRCKEAVLTSEDTCRHI